MPNKIEFALKEYHKYNKLRNDLDAYLWDLGEWALKNLSSMPNPKDFGLPVTEQSDEGDD